MWPNTAIWYGLKQPVYLKQWWIISIFFFCFFTQISSNFRIYVFSYNLCLTIFKLVIFIYDILQKQTKVYVSGENI